MNERCFRVALLQLKVTDDKCQNIENAAKFIRKAKQEAAELIVLSECFNTPYSVDFFRKYSERIPNGDTCKMLSKLSKELSVHIIGGTIPEEDGDNIFNTCTVWNPEGDMVAKFRKIHLFDVDIVGGITFKESDAFSPGNELVTFQMNGTKIGLGVCHDMRFEEMAKLYRLSGCEVLVYPGAFNMTTGPIHWELVQRARAADNQVYVMAISPARGNEGYIAWGHSQVTNPWGKVVAQAGHQEEMVICDVNLEECDKVRSQIPTYRQRRTDIYDTVKVK